MTVILQGDGAVARFSASAGEEVFLNLKERLGAGKDAPPQHPTLTAVRNSSARSIRVARCLDAGAQ
jgi:hypothetical protein